MKYHVYTNYNRLVEAYERPLIKIEDPDEYVEMVARDFKASEDAAKAKIKEYNIIYRGTYDDVTGVFDFCEPNVILNCALLGGIPNEQKKEEVKCD